MHTKPFWYYVQRHKRNIIYNTGSFSNYAKYYSSLSILFNIILFYKQWKKITKLWKSKTFKLVFNRDTILNI